MRATVGFRLLPLLVRCCCWLARRRRRTRMSGALRPSAANPPSQVSIGKNSVGEDCTQRPAPAKAPTYSAAPGSSRARGSARAGRARPATLRDWPPTARGAPASKRRFRCEPPVATTILGGQPDRTAAMHAADGRLGACRHGGAGERHRLVCRRRAAGGAGDGTLRSACWPVWRARTRSPSNSGADALLASRLAAKAFSSGDIGQFDTLMAAGTRANLADNPGAAESAFRAALALQQKALGQEQPEHRDGADVARAAAVQ